MPPFALPTILGFRPIIQLARVEKPGGIIGKALLQERVGYFDDLIAMFVLVFLFECDGLIRLEAKINFVVEPGSTTSAQFRNFGVFEIQIKCPCRTNGKSGIPLHKNQATINFKLSEDFASASADLIRL